MGWDDFMSSVKILFDLGQVLVYILYTLSPCFTGHVVPLGRLAAEGLPFGV